MRSHLNERSSTRSSLALLVGLVLVICLGPLSGCRVTELEVKPVTAGGVPLRGSDVRCPAEDDRGTASMIGNVRLSQYGPVPICRDELADKVVPWTGHPDCGGQELIRERLLGRRRLGHTVPLLGWFGIGRPSEPGRYRLHRTTQSEQEILRNATVYFCVRDSMTIDGVRFSDDDVIAYDGRLVAKLIDGGDIGTSREEIDAFAAIAPNVFLISYRRDFEIDDAHQLPGLTGIVRDEDVLMFEASSLGETTRGVFSRFLDGSHLGLDSNADINGLETGSNGVLFCSFDKRTKLKNLTAEASDVVELRLSRDENGELQGAWRIAVKGSKCGLGDRDIDGLTLDSSGRPIVSVEERFLQGTVIHEAADALVLDQDAGEGRRLVRSSLIGSDTVLSGRGTTLAGSNITALSRPTWGP